MGVTADGEGDLGGVEGGDHGEEEIAGEDAVSFEEVADGGETGQLDAGMGRVARGEHRVEAAR